MLPVPLLAVHSGSVLLWVNVKYLLTEVITCATKAPAQASGGIKGKMIHTLQWKKRHSPEVQNFELQPIGCGGVQVCAPIYKLVMTNLGGEQRFAAAVARRLQSLGALTRGDRRAASGVDLSESNFDSPLGRKSLRCFRTLLSPYAKTKGAVVLSLL